MKRFAGFFFAICFMAVLFSGISFSASAEETVKLQAVSLDFSTPTDGSALPDAFTVPQGFVVDQIYWEIYRDGAWQSLPQEEWIYSEQQSYKLRVQLTCAEGYCIDYSAFPSGFMPAQINGQPSQATFYGEHDGQNVTQWKGVVLETILYGNAVPVVELLDISGIPLNTGDVFDASMVAVNDTHVMVQACQIQVDQEAVDSFQLGHGWYNIHIEFAALDGYILNPQMITINGVPASESGWEIAYGFEAGEGWISLTCEREPEAYLDGVTLSGAPVSITADAAITAPELAVKWSTNGTVSISKVQWLDSDYQDVVDAFVQGNTYYLAITLNTDGEMPFRDFFNLELLDEADAYFAVVLATAQNADTAIAYIPYTYLTALDQIQIHLPQPEVGNAPQQPAPEEGALFVIETYQWTDLADMSAVTVFAEGHRYQLNLSVRPLDGYQLNENTTVLVNGEMVHAVIDPDIATITLEFSLVKQVQHLEILLTDPAQQAAPTAPVLADPSLGTIQFQWIDRATGNEVTVFEEGHTYQLFVELAPADDMEFVELTVLLNGDTIELSALNGEYAAFTVEYSFRRPIDRVDLYAPELKVGAEVKPSDIVVLTEGVVLQSGNWINALTFEELNGIVEKVHYMLRFAVNAVEEFEFADAVQIYLNGQLLGDYDGASNSVTGSVGYDLRDEVREIQISGMPQITIGGSTASITMVVPEGAPYIVEANWLLYGGDYQFAGPGGAFEDGKLYYLEILVKPQAGYRIAEDATIFADGMEFSGITVAGDNGLWLYKQYNCGLQVIDRVDITVTVPVVGNAPVVVTLPEGTPISLKDFSWAYCESGLFADAVDLLEGDIFEAGYHYMISGALVADKGYVFAENVILSVNGVATNIDLGDLGVINLGDTAFLAHSFGLLKEPVQPPAPTGDSIGLVVSLMFASAFVWIVTKKKK